MEIDENENFVVSLREIKLSEQQFSVVSCHCHRIDSILSSSVASSFCSNKKLPLDGLFGRFSETQIPTVKKTNLNKTTKITTACCSSSILFTHHRSNSQCFGRKPVLCVNFVDDGQLQAGSLNIHESQIETGQNSFTNRSVAL